MKKYLISYADDEYASQKEFFKESAIKASFFDEIKIFGPQDIGEEFSNKVGETLQMKTGGGYWLWKPYFIKNMMDEINENDILIYCDCGCLINPNGLERFIQYLDLLAHSESGTIDFELPFEEFKFTKKEIFEYFNSSPDVVNSNQLIATVLLFRKCAQSVRLINRWYQVACDNPLLFTNELSHENQKWNFIESRNDQSVFSVIRKILGTNAIPDETYFLDFVRDGNGFPFWAARLK